MTSLARSTRAKLWQPVVDIQNPYWISKIITRAWSGGKNLVVVVLIFYFFEDQKVNTYYFFRWLKSQYGASYWYFIFSRTKKSKHIIFSRTRKSIHIWMTNACASRNEINKEKTFTSHTVSLLNKYCAKIIFCSWRWDSFITPLVGEFAPIFSANKIVFKILSTKKYRHW